MLHDHLLYCIRPIILWVLISFWIEWWFTYIYMFIRAILKRDWFNIHCITINIDNNDLFLKPILKMWIYEDIFIDDLITWSLKNTWNSGNIEVGHTDRNVSFIDFTICCIVPKVFGPVAQPKSARTMVFEGEEEESFPISNFSLISWSIFSLSAFANNLCNKREKRE